MDSTTVLSTDGDARFLAWVSVWGVLPAVY